MLFSLVTATVFATSVLSGVLGMAGGMILMAVLVSALGVAGAMMLHGAVQATSNGSRAWFLRQHIVWQPLPAYLAGAAVAVGGFVAIALVPDPGVVLLLVGLFPWLARFNKRLGGLDITHLPTAFACGAVVTAAQLLAGASGPVLDVFYVRSPLNRHQIVASKALTQTIGHVLKMFYYGVVVAVAVTLPWWFFALCIITAVAGTRVGTLLLERWNESAFQRYSQAVILVIATLCMAQGLRLLLT